jgi:hypothetical protein
MEDEPLESKFIAVEILSFGIMYILVLSIFSYLISGE